MRLLRRLWAHPRARTLLGAAAGVAAGVLYSHYVGCLTGSCPMTSNPFTAGLAGGLLGASLFAPDGKPSERASEPQRPQ